MDYAPFLTLIGSGLGTAIVGLLFKRNFDRKLEIQRAFLQRASRVHEHQVEVLTTLYYLLSNVNTYMKLLSKSGTFKGEKPEDYAKKFLDTANKAIEEFERGRLLLPPPLAKRCDEFFEKVSKWRFRFAWAHEPVVDGTQRGQFWDEAADMAFKDVPSLLEAIDKDARVIINGESQLP